MGRTLTNDQMRMALKGDRFKTVKKAITQEYMCLVKQELTAENVQKALDEGGGHQPVLDSHLQSVRLGFHCCGSLRPQKHTVPARAAPGLRVYE